MENLKVNQKVWYIEINNANEEKSYRKNGVVIEELKILGISEHKIVLNNVWFTTLDVKKEHHSRFSHYHYLDQINVSIRTQNHILGDGIFISIYSTKNPSKSILKKMYAKAAIQIDKDFGFLMNHAKDVLWSIVNDYKLK